MSLPRLRICLLRSAANLYPVAKADIDQDEDLFSISRTGILSVENSTLFKEPRGQQIITDLDDSWLSLILVLIYERENDNSPWQEYLAVLRDTKLDTLMYWTEEELAEFQASAIKDKIGKAGADETFRTKIVPAVQANSDLFPSASTLSKDDILSLAHWAGSTIMAYAFDIEKQPSAQAQDEEGYVSDEEEEFLPKGMVPMADMLNADADRNNARLFYEEDTVVMRAIKPVKAGEELFNDYGPLPRADLLRRYGYITNNYVKYDVVELSTPFIIETVKSHLPAEDQKKLTDDYLAEIEEALEDKDYWEDAHIISQYTEDDEDPLFPPGLQMLLYRLTATSATKHAKRPEKIEAADREKMVNACVVVYSARLKQYATGVQEDQDLCRRFEDGSIEDTPSNRRKYMAWQVRLGEKQLLEIAMAHLPVYPPKNTNGASIHDTAQDERPAKRTKFSR